MVGYIKTRISVYIVSSSMFYTFLEVVEMETYV